MSTVRDKVYDWVKRLRDRHMLTLVVVLVVALVGVGLYIYKRERDFRQVSENSYNMAFVELVDYVQNVETYLAKSLISSTPEHGRNTNKCVERSKFSTKLFSKVTNGFARISKYIKIFKPGKWL